MSSDTFQNCDDKDDLNTSEEQACFQDKLDNSSEDEQIETNPWLQSSLPVIAPTELKTIADAAAESDEEEEDQQFAMDTLLPCSIGSLTIKRLQWSDFKGSPNYNQRWNAHVYWGISYTYGVTLKTSKHKKVAYLIDPVDVRVWLKRKSWTKKRSAHLLNHEQGHYLIGCICSLEFKKQVQTVQFTDNYRLEIPRLFESILRQHIQLEKRYDKETNHRLNRPQQIVWDKILQTKILHYQAYFSGKDKLF